MLPGLLRTAHQPTQRGPPARPASSLARSRPTTAARPIWAQPPAATVSGRDTARRRRRPFFGVRALYARSPWRARQGVLPLHPFKSSRPAFPRTSLHRAPPPPLAPSLLLSAAAETPSPPPAGAPPPGASRRRRSLPVPRPSRHVSPRHRTATGVPPRHEDRASHRRPPLSRFRPFSSFPVAGE